MDYSVYRDRLVQHYETAWQASGTPVPWDEGPRADLPAEFTILAFPPRPQRAMWTYATAGMALPEDDRPIELHLFSPEQYAAHAELLTAIAHYHRTGRRLDVGHTVNFGRPWMPGSPCDHGLISLPYLDGPAVEVLETDAYTVHCYWLIPITQREVTYKKTHGLDALEAAFEQHNVDYLDPQRESVVNDG